MFEYCRSGLIEIPKKKIIDGKLFDSGSVFFDKLVIDQNSFELLFIVDGDMRYIGNNQFSNINDGKWLLSFDNTSMVIEIVRLPKNMIKIATSQSDFMCNITDINFLSQITLELIKTRKEG